MLARSVDCVLIDLGLPDAEGFEALDQIRTAALDAPVVVLGERDDDRFALETVRAGAQDYVVRSALDGRALARALRHAVERQRVEAALAHRALHDPLTRLPNRVLFGDRLRLALSRLARTQTCLAVLFLDLDGFKSVNDTLGHVAGDHFLAEVADRLRSGLRGGDTAARFGGDEFVVLCEDVASAAQVRGIAERIVDEVPGGVSVGVALAVDGSEQPDALLREADAAMYVVKRRGGRGFELSGVRRLAA